MEPGSTLVLGAVDWSNEITLRNSVAMNLGLALEDFVAKQDDPFLLLQRASLVLALGFGDDLNDAGVFQWFSMMKASIDTMIGKGMLITMATGNEGVVRASLLVLWLEPLLT
jgi:hypothetical protein